MQSFSNNRVIYRCITLILQCHFAVTPQTDIPNTLDQVGRVVVLCWRDKVLLDRPHRLQRSKIQPRSSKLGGAGTHDESGENAHTATLVVGARSPGASKGLLADDGTGALVVDVEVSGGVPQFRSHVHESSSLLGENGTSQTILGSRVDELERLFILFVVVDVDLGQVSTYGHLWGDEVLTVMTGPKISWVMVIDLGSLVTMTVGWMKYPFELSPKYTRELRSFLLD